MKQKIKSPIFWIWVCIIMSLIFGVFFKITNYYEFYVLTLIMWAYPLLFMIIAIVFAWIINPIKYLIKKNKKE
jgi:hypothetical protein